MRPQFIKWSVVLCLWICATVAAVAGEAIQSLVYSNYTTGYVIAADASDPMAPTPRDAITVNARAAFSMGPLTVTYPTYRLRFRLLDTNGQPVSIYDSGGHPVTAYDLEDSPAFTRLIRSVTNNYSVSLRPAARLSPYAPYQVELQLYRQEGLLYVATGARAVTEAKLFYHFTNLVSGDTAVNVIATAKEAAFTRVYLVTTVADKNRFLADVQVELRRYDDFSGPQSSANVSVYLDYTLRDAGGAQAEILLKTNRTLVVKSVPNHLVTIFPEYAKVPALATVTAPLELEPADGVQLDPVNKRYQLGVTVSHLETPSQAAEPGNTVTTPAQQLLHFNGQLLFGDIRTTIYSLANTPMAGQMAQPFYVKTLLAVDHTNSVVDGDNSFLQLSYHRFGDGTPLDVRLRNDGVAELASGSTVLYPRTTPDFASASQVSLVRSGITLDTQGAHCGMVTVFLPTGAGYCMDPSTNTLINYGAFLNVGLNQDLVPKTNLTYQGHFYICEETKPLWIEGSSLTWNVAAGQFEITPTGSLLYVRAADLTALEEWGPSLADPNAAIKPSNEQYFRFAGAALGGPIVVKADRRGNAQMSMEMSMNDGRFRAHFPARADIWWTAAGHLSITNDMVDSAVSYLPHVKHLEVDYAQDCTQSGCPGQGSLGVLELAAEDDRLTFTCDGGLTISSSLRTPSSLAWGFIPGLARYAHRTTPFSRASFHMPGPFLRGDQTALDMVHRPGVVLLTGIGEEDYGYLERPETPAYNHEGRANYAGLNFRVGQDAAISADSVLAGESTGVYPLTGRGKYYVRAGGLSGIHEAVHGKFPETAKLYGYEINFGNFGLSFLDSQNKDSRTEGYLAVPFPAGFQQEFAELKFSCLGGLESASVPATSTNKLLNYWLADFSTEAIRFQRGEGSTCDPSIGFLVLGVTAHAAHVEQPLYGSLGFLSDGNLLTRRMWQLPEYVGKVPEVDSRLKLPTLVTIKGPANETYTFTPVSDAYYNNHNYDLNNAASGFINMAGKLAVPFFEEFKVHIHTSAQASNAFAPIYMMGGWSRDAMDLDAGWNDPNDGTNYFIHASFDADNIGFPKSGADLSQYREDPNGPFRVRARQSWLAGVDFDFPLAWSTATRSFKSARPSSTDFLLLNVRNEVNYLSPKTVDLVFGEQYAGLPQLTPASLSFNAQSGQGAASAMDAAAPAVRAALLNGFQRMDVILGNQLNTFFQPVLDEFLDAQVEALYHDLAGAYAGQQPNQDWNTWKTTVEAALDSYFASTGTLNPKFKHNLVGDPGATTGMLKQLRAGLSALIEAIDAFNGAGGFLPPDGNRKNDKALVVALITQLAPQYAGVIEGANLDASLQSLAPALNQIRASLETYRSELTSQRDLLKGQTKDQLELENQNAFPAIDTAMDRSAKDIYTLVVSTLDYSQGNPFAPSLAATLKGKMRQKIADQFFTTSLMAQLQVVFKHRYQDLDTAVREALDDFFLQINQVVRDAITPALAQADNDFKPFFGDLGGLMSAARMHGTAHINGDALNEVRLDGRYRWKVPETLEFAGSMIIRSQNSTGSKSGCGDPGGKAAEVILEGNNVPLDWFSPDLRANIGGKFSFDAAPSPKLMGLGGSFVLLNQLTFEAFRVNGLSAMFAFGAQENYISGSAAVQFQDYKLAGGHLLRPDLRTGAHRLVGSPGGGRSRHTPIHRRLRLWRGMDAHPRRQLYFQYFRRGRRRGLLFRRRSYLRGQAHGRSQWRGALPGVHRG